MDLKITNIRSHGRNELFRPIDLTHIRMYVCGPTVYDLAHVGNARPAVVFDVLARVLKRLYPTVTYVRNITDIDDKINARAAERPIDEITALTSQWVSIRVIWQRSAACRRTWNRAPPITSGR